MAAEGTARRFPDARPHGHGIELCVVQAIEQVNGARPRSGEADTDLTRELRVRTGHECGHLLVAGLNESDPVIVPVQSPHEAVDAVPGITVDGAHAPSRELFQ